MTEPQYRPYKKHSSAYSAANILDLLEKQGILLEDINAWHPDMISASQLLCIDDHAVCSDQLLIQRVQYTTLEIMQREIATLTVKKEVFSDFESTITQIPKYCYPQPDLSSAVLIHSVPRFTLENILSSSEQLYPAEHNHDQIHYLRTWADAIISTYKNNIPAERKGKLLHAMKTLHSLVNLAPPRIPLKQRKRFAAQLVQTVYKHHISGIHHDCITPYTLFFRSLNQPVVLANYTGISSTILSDFYPADFNEMAPLFSKNSPHLQDLVCLSLITVRILLGERIDPSQPFIDSPRPFSLIIKELLDKSNLLARHPLQDSFLYLNSFSFLMHHLLHLAIHLFEINRFPNWRRLNRATGLFWRSMPVLGTMCDILFPTRCASTLRSLLNKHWFQFHFSGKQEQDVQKILPTLANLLAILKTRSFSKKSYYESVFSPLQGEYAKKRHSFDSIMEVSSNQSDPPKIPLRKYVYIAAAGLILILSSITGYLLLQHPEKEFEQPVEKQSTKQIVMTPSPKEPIPPVTPAAPAVSPPKKAPPVKSEKVLPAQKSAKKVTKKPVKKRVIKSNPVLLPPPVTASIDTLPPVTPPAPPVTVCRLKSTASLWKVFTVEGTCESCNLADVVLVDTKTGDTLRIGDDTNRLNRYYIARKTNSGFGEIITAKWCNDKTCENGLLYEVKNKTISSMPATVSPGDLIGYNYLPINAYIIKDRKKMQD